MSADLHAADPLARALDQLAALAAIRGDAVDVALYARGARTVRDLGILNDAALGPLVEAPAGSVDVDPELLTRLRHMYDAGAWVLVESAIADLPADLRWLFESGAVTIDQLEKLHAALGCVSATDLADAVERQAVREVPGLDSTVEYAIAAALFNLRGSIPRIPLGRAAAIVAPITACLVAQPGISQVTPVGSFRRGQDTVGDIELLAAADDPAAAIEEVSRLPDVVRVLHRGPRRLYVRLDRAQVGVRFPPPHRAGAELLQLTGAVEHLNALRAVATERGGRLSAVGFHPEGGGAPIGDREEAIYDALGLPFIPPEVREGEGEVAAAQHGALPVLVSREDIRGDLHLHTTYSDGRDSVAAMVAGCRALGYEYCAITDHSPHSSATRNLTVDAVKRQAEEIAALRESHPDIAILHGCEVDILPDGRLDFPDRVLERFDIVLASLHERAGQGPDQLLRRYLAAVRHPLVALITHPSNRLVPHRAGYEIEYDRLFEAAAETGTLLEVDGAPGHLDMPGELARRATSLGVRLTIDSDCHRADLLDRQMRFGVMTARRGWVEPRHVLNTRSIDEVRAFVARKR